MRCMCWLKSEKSWQPGRQDLQHLGRLKLPASNSFLCLHHEWILAKKGISQKYSNPVHPEPQLFVLLLTVMYVHSSNHLCRMKMCYLEALYILNLLHTKGLNGLRHELKDDTSAGSRGSDVKSSDQSQPTGQKYVGQLNGAEMFLSDVQVFLHVDSV